MAGPFRANREARERSPEPQPGVRSMSADLANIRVPPECREMIRAGALVAVNTSGGKDSQSMTILLSRIVPRDQIVAVHAPLVDVEWPGTIEFIRATLPPGMPLILAPVASDKTLLDSIEERGRFPSPKVWWCTSSLKRGPIERELRRYLKANPRFCGRIVSAMGMRAEESAARARKPPWRLNERNSRAGRTWFDWLPVFNLTERKSSALSVTPDSRRIRLTGWACRGSPACSASWPHAPISVPPRSCNRRSMRATSISKSASATRSLRPAFPCRS